MKFQLSGHRSSLEPRAKFFGRTDKDVWFYDWRRVVPLAELDDGAIGRIVDHNVNVRKLIIIDALRRPP